MALSTKILPKTVVFLDNQDNPTTVVVSKNLVSGNDSSETFVLKKNLLNSPLINFQKDIETLQIKNAVIVDFNSFALIFKSINIAPYTLPQIYAFPIDFELINNEIFELKFPRNFVELQ